MKISCVGIDLIKKWEGLGDGDRSLPGLQPYMDAVGIWTIGYGHAITVGGKFLRGRSQKAVAYDIYDGGITLEEAELLLREDLRRFEAAVNRYIKVPTAQHEYDAFVSLSFNIGAHAFKKSSALREHNRGNKEDVPRRIKLWNKAGGRVLRGLVNRREEEAKIYKGKQ